MNFAKIQNTLGDKVRIFMTIHVDTQNVVILEQRVNNSRNRLNYVIQRRRLYVYFLFLEIHIRDTRKRDEIFPRESRSMEDFKLRTTFPGLCARVGKEKGKEKEKGNGNGNISRLDTVTYIQPYGFTIPTVDSRETTYTI